MAGLGAQGACPGRFTCSSPVRSPSSPCSTLTPKATKTGDPSVDGRTIGAFFAESLMKNAHQTMFAGD